MLQQAAVKVLAAVGQPGVLLQVAANTQTDNIIAAAR